ncbi:MAG: O-antigen ligase family protein, partial [Planctomycetes bacterium]|nr:O-antigen ligase family protein [Planctomycetota bacterium]
MADALHTVSNRPPGGLPLVIRGLAALIALYICAYPARAFLLSTDVFWLVKAAWLAAIVVGGLRPFAGVVLMLLAVPLLPNAPFLFREVPHGIVHLAVFSQALPLLGRAVIGRIGRRSDAVLWAAAALLAVGVTSVAASYAGDWVASFSVGDFLRHLHVHLSECVFNNPSPELSNRLLALMTLLAGMLTYLAVSWAVNTRPGAERTIYRIVAAAAVAVAALGVGQFATGFGLRGMWRDFDPGIVRVNSTYSDPNALGTYCALLVPMMIGLFGAASGFARRLGWLAAAALALVALVMTAGRMAYVAAAVGLLVLALLVIRLGLDRADAWPLISRWFRPAVGGGLVLVLAGTVLAAAVSTSLDLRHRDQTSYLRTVLYTLNLRQPLDDTLKGRTQMWRRSARMIAAAPVFGLGLGTAYRKSTAFDPADGPRLPRLSAHNTFLNVASETGAVGLLAYLGLLAAVFGTLFGGLTDAAPRETRWLRAVLAAGLVAYGVTMISGDRTILAEDVVVF